MKVIIAGSRQGFTYRDVEKAMTMSGFPVTAIVSGTARGVDRLGEDWAERNNIPVTRFPALWDAYGKGAGYIRNAKMADNADALVALWDGKSKGTQHMIKLAKKKGLQVVTYFKETE